MVELRQRELCTDNGWTPDRKGDMTTHPQCNRRRFLGTAAMTIAAAGMDLGCLGEASERLPRQLAAFDSGSEWLNSPPLLASALRGRVVLVNFWTFTCINWLRTLPYVRAWAEKYRQQLVVIGVH